MLDTDVFWTVLFCIHSKKPPGFFNQSLDRVKLPSSLQTLTFGHLGKVGGGRSNDGWWLTPWEANPYGHLGEAFNQSLEHAEIPSGEGLSCFLPRLVYSPVRLVCVLTPRTKKTKKQVQYLVKHTLPKLRSTMFGVFFYPDETHPPNHLRWFTTPIRNSPRFTWTSARWPPGEALNLWFWEGASTKAWHLDLVLRVMVTC